MGRPLKISKYSAMSGIFTTGPTAAAVVIDNGYNPFAAPTALDTATVVLPQPATTPLPFTGVVGGKRGSQVSATNPVVECQVNIAKPDGTGFGAHNGVILRQKGSRKFLVMDLTAIADDNLIVGATYQIAVVGTTDWGLFGCPASTYTNGLAVYAVGQQFTCTAPGSNSGNGTAYAVGQCVLKAQAVGSLTVGNMSITMSISNSTPTYISKLTNKFVQDFNGGETGGNANTGDVWNPDQVVNDIEYAANFFVDGEQFAKSGAEVATWSTTGLPVNSNQPGNNGTLLMAEIEKYTS
jgi:hypothetical protein